MSAVSRVVTCLIAAGAFALGMASYVTAGLIPLIEQDFDVTTALAAQLVTAFTLAYAIGSPIMVAILPAHRQRPALLGMLTLFVVANALSAVAPDMIMLMALRAAAGLSAGTYLALQDSPLITSAVAPSPSSWAVWPAARCWACRPGSGWPRIWAGRQRCG